MAHTVKLKKRYPPDGNRAHWTWILRYWSVDAAKENSEVIGWYAPAKDTWQPRHSKGPRLTERQAQEIQVQRRNDLREGRVGQPEPAQEVRVSDPATTPFAKWIDHYMEETRGTVRERTLREIRHAMEMLQEVASPATAAAVDHRTVKRFVQGRLRTGIRPSTVWKEVAALRRVWYDAQLSPNPWVDKKLRRQLKCETMDWHWYSREQFQQLLAAVDAKRQQTITNEGNARGDPRSWLAFKGMLTLAYTAGLRLGELENLTWADLDSEEGFITIAPKKAGETTVAWGPKDHERRIVPFAPVAQAVLHELRPHGPVENPYVFLSDARHAHVMAKYRAGEWPEWRRLLNNVLQKFNRLCKAANVPRCAFHSLRKSFCTNLLEGGVAPHAVQQIMGHASLETTIKYYSKVRRDQIAAASRVAELSVTGKGRPQSVEARPVRTA